MILSGMWSRRHDAHYVDACCTRIGDFSCGGRTSANAEVEHRQGPERESQDIQTMPVVSYKSLKIVSYVCVVFAALLHIEVTHCAINHVGGQPALAILIVARDLPSPEHVP